MVVYIVFQFIYSIIATSSVFFLVVIAVNRYQRQFSIRLYSENAPVTDAADTMHSNVCQFDSNVWQEMHSNVGQFDSDVLQVTHTNVWQFDSNVWWVTHTNVGQFDSNVWRVTHTNVGQFDSDVWQVTHSNVGQFDSNVTNQGINLLKTKFNIQVAVDELSDFCSPYVAFVNYHYSSCCWWVKWFLQSLCNICDCAWANQI